MEINQIFYTPSFEKALKRLPKVIQLKAWQKEDIFRKDCFHPSLKTHKLKGKSSGYCSFSVNYDYQILFKFEEKNQVTFIDIGTHNIYK